MGGLLRVRNCHAALPQLVQLREEGRLPIRSVQWYLRTVHQRGGHRERHSPGAAGPTSSGREVDRASPVVHADVKLVSPVVILSPIE